MPVHQSRISMHRYKCLCCCLMNENFMRKAQNSWCQYDNHSLNHMERAENHNAFVRSKLVPDAIGFDKSDHNSYQGFSTWNFLVTEFIERFIWPGQLFIIVHTCWPTCVANSRDKSNTNLWLILMNVDPGVVSSSKIRLLSQLPCGGSWRDQF